jgi:small subunit ribosomal protein S21
MAGPEAIRENREGRHSKIAPEMGYNLDLGGISSLVYIVVQPNESIDSALKRFNLKLQQSGLLRELKEHSHYEKPSEKRRRQRRRRSSRP